MKKIVIIGQIAKYPLGGVTWDWLNYLLGFRDLGFEVFYFEDSPEWLYNPILNSVAFSEYNLEYLKKVMVEFGFENNWTYLTRSRDLKKNKIHGNQDIKNILNSADAIFNICGSSDMSKLIRDFSIPKSVKKIYIDGDPMINQIKMIQEKEKATRKSHDYFFTYAENIGAKDSEIPLEKGLKWITTRFPVHLSSWKSVGNNGKFTTIANWQSYKGFLYKGKKYSGSKSMEFLKFSEIPILTGQNMEIAITADTEEKENKILKRILKSKGWQKNKINLEKMEKGGWYFEDALKISKDYHLYKNYIENSMAEFSVAKNIYVKAKTGWFSGRSACYLAAGKPVILQDTGFSKFILTGDGVFSFKTLHEAKKAVEEVGKNYEHHSKEARKIAEKYFDSDIVLEKLIADCKI